MVCDKFVKMRGRITLIPRLFSHWWEALDHPHRLMDQRFGMALRPEQFFSPSLFDRYIARSNFPYLRAWPEMVQEEMDSGYSVVKNDKDKFHVALDVQQFKPDEVTVKVVDNFIVVEGKHEEQNDDHGIISRHFVRKYMVPDQCDPEKASSTLSSDGVLTITAPRKPEAVEQKKEKVINIEHTGQPSIQDQKDKK